MGNVPISVGWHGTWSERFATQPKEVAMNAKQIGLSVVLADFAALTAYAVYQYGLIGFFAIMSPDAELIQRVAGGDREGFAELYDRFAAILFGIVLRILRSRAEAEEVLQDTFLQIWQRSASFDERRGRVIPWLTLLARSRALDRLRNRNLQGRPAAEAAAEPEPQSADAVDEVMAGEEGLLVRRALAAISEDQH